MPRAARASCKYGCDYKMYVIRDATFHLNLGFFNAKTYCYWRLVAYCHFLYLLLTMFSIRQSAVKFLTVCIWTLLAHQIIRAVFIVMYFTLQLYRLEEYDECFDIYRHLLKNTHVRCHLSCKTGFSSAYFKICIIICCDI